MKKKVPFDRSDLKLLQQWIKKETDTPEKKKAFQERASNMVKGALGLDKCRQKTDKKSKI